MTKHFIRKTKKQKIEKNKKNKKKTFHQLRAGIQYLKGEANTSKLYSEQKWTRPALKHLIGFTIIHWSSIVLQKLKVENYFPFLSIEEN